MATYLILNCLFLSCVLFLFRVRSTAHKRAWITMFGVLIILTIIFDNLLIYLHIVGYNVDTLLGVYIGVAPIEDFFYAVLAAFLIPSLWHTLEKTDAP